MPLTWFSGLLISVPVDIELLFQLEFFPIEERFSYFFCPLGVAYLSSTRNRWNIRRRLNV